MSFTTYSRIAIVDIGHYTGTAVLKGLSCRDFINARVFISEKRLLDDIEEFSPEFLIVIGAKTGGIKFNIDFCGDIIYSSLRLQADVIHLAQKIGVRKLILIGTSCMYPKHSLQPIKEEYLMAGQVEETSEAHALAKRAGYGMCRAYKKQFGLNATVVVPATIYGPGLHFDAENSHVISAFIKKFYDAKIASDEEVTIWGTGKARREFIYIEDLINALIYILKSEGNLDLINVGVGYDYSIQELAEIVAREVQFTGVIKNDLTAPEGVFQKLLDNTKILSTGWRSIIPFHVGVRLTYEWFREHFS